MKTNIFTAGVAAAAMALPLGADALELTFEDYAGGGTVTIVDGGAGDVDGVENGTIIAGALTLGGSSATVTTSFYVDEAGHSQLSLNVGNATGGLEGLAISSSHDAFAGAAASPDLTNITFALNGTVISPDGQVDGFGSYDLTAFGFGSVNTNGDSAVTSAAAALAAPFSLGVSTYVNAGTTATYDASIVAAVPLPAAGLMLLAGLGGLGAMRRRKG